MSTRQTPRIFISHSSKDIEFVKRLANDLCYILGNDDAVWFDVLGLQGGDAWWPKIVKEINTRGVFILVISPDAMKSPWVDDELQIAWRHKNTTTATRKLIIPIHFRECKKVDDYLKNLQWVQFLPPETYQSAFNQLLRALKVTLDARATEFLRKLETLNADFARPVLPKSSADFDTEELEETLNLLGKYTAYYISLSRWDEVQRCVEEALPLVPHDPHWLNIKQEAFVRLGYKEGLSSRQPFPDTNSRGRSNTTNKIKDVNTINLPNKAPNARGSHSESRGSNPNQASSKGRARHKSNVNTSSSSQHSTMKTIADFAQPSDLNGLSRIQGSMTKISSHYLKNLADFMPRLIQQNNRFLQAICLIDVLIIPFMLGLSLQPYFALVFLVGLFVSFLAFIITPVIKHSIAAIISIIFFSLSWITICVFLNWLINQFFSSMLAGNSKQAVQLDYKFAIVVGAISVLSSFLIHLFLIFNTDYYIEKKVAYKPNRKRRRR